MKPWADGKNKDPTKKSSPKATKVLLITQKPFLQHVKKKSFLLQKLTEFYNKNKSAVLIKKKYKRIKRTLPEKKVAKRKEVAFNRDHAVFFCVFWRNPATSCLKCAVASSLYCNRWWSLGLKIRPQHVSGPVVIVLLPAVTRGTLVDGLVARCHPQRDCKR